MYQADKKQYPVIFFHLFFSDDDAKYNNYIQSYRENLEPFGGKHFKIPNINCSKKY